MDASRTPAPGLQSNLVHASGLHLSANARCSHFSRGNNSILIAVKQIEVLLGHRPMFEEADFTVPVGVEATKYRRRIGFHARQFDELCELRWTEVAAAI
jgi:hypothetical protein